MESPSSGVFWTEGFTLWDLKKRALMRYPVVTASQNNYIGLNGRASSPPKKKYVTYAQKMDEPWWDWKCTFIVNVLVYYFSNFFNYVI